MKIGIVSDTHSKELPQQMLKDFADVELILHLGDHSDLAVYKTFSRMKETISVSGNMENEEVFSQFPIKQILEIENCRIGMFHGEGPPGKVLQSAQRAFKDDKIDVALFGHSHRPFNEKINGVLFFNPGSPTDTFFAPYLSYGILEITDGNIEAKIVKVEN